MRGVRIVGPHGDVHEELGRSREGASGLARIQVHPVSGEIMSPCDAEMMIDPPAVNATPGSIHLRRAIAQACRPAGCSSPA